MFAFMLLSAFCLICSGLPRQYHFVNESKSWAEAQSYCRSTYTDLATVDNMEDMNRLLESTNGSYNSAAWIGLYDDPQKSWAWSLDDPQFYREGERDFRVWFTEQFFTGGRDLCVVSFRGWWISNICDASGPILPFICFDGRENATESLVFIQEFKTWTEAQSYCRETYTDLASIRNREENRMIASVVHTVAWIGLYRTRKWSDQSNSLFRYWLWQPLQANLDQPSLTCTTVLFGNSGRWIEEYCNITQPFICYTVSNGSIHQYHFVNESKSWTEAQSFCRLTYTDLATVNNMEDMNRLLETVNGSYNGAAWIGLYDEPQNDWRWSLDDPKYYKEGERDFRSWFHYPLSGFQPNVCALTSQLGWIDISCSTDLPFVCYNGANQTYVVVSSPRNWTDAQSYCREHYTDLASVRSTQENIDITGQLQVSWEAWIGLHYTITWSDQSNSSFTYWKAGQPDNGGDSMIDFLDQHCTATSFSDAGRWTDENCLSTFPFICYSLNATAEPSPTPSNQPKTNGQVIGLRSKVVAKGLSQSETENLVLITIEEELIRLGIPSNFTVRLRSTQKITP